MQNQLTEEKLLAEQTARDQAVHADAVREEILGEHGHTLRRDELAQFADDHGLLASSIEPLQAYLSELSAAA